MTPRIQREFTNRYSLWARGLLGDLCDRRRIERAMISAAHQLMLSMARDRNADVDRIMARYSFGVDIDQVTGSLTLLVEDTCAGLRPDDKRREDWLTWFQEM